MTFGRAFAYFLREALIGLRRSSRVSLLAVLTIAASLFMAGFFLVAGHQLREVVDSWRQQARIIVYLQRDSTPEEVAAIAAEVRRRVPGLDVETISSEDAAARFRRLFPSLTGLLETWQPAPLPPSIEIEAPRTGTTASVAESLWSLEADPRVSMVDDDRDWLERLRTLILFLEAAGLALGLVLLAAAVFTIAGVIRLTLFLYRDEIAVMRLVGATEFYIRGPFYVAGLLQGLLGSTLGLAALWSLWWFVRARMPSALAASLLEGGFLPAGEIATLLAVGAAAGLAGAVISLRRERPASEQG